MKKISLLFGLLYSILSFSQINFEKSYFIDNSNNITECLIKNIDWRNNPSSFEYKINDSGEVKTADIKEVKLFEILNKVKYLRSDVKIDKSPKALNKLSLVKAPEFVEETLFLKELVSGTANLYKYQNGSLVRFFFQKGDQPITQLVYKPYKVESIKFAYNTEYKQQLEKSLDCGDNNTKIERTDYKETPLSDVFLNYNNCVNPNYKQTALQVNKGQFNLNIRPRINFSTLKLYNDNPTHLTADMENETSFSAGLELEYVLPFNKNKWALVLEPTYHSYKSQSTIEGVNFIVGGKLITNVKFESIEIPIGARYYMYINQKSRLFINLQYVIDIALDSSIESVREDNSLYKYTKVRANPSVAAGFGYSYNNKFGLEIRQIFHRNDYDFWAAKFKSTSLIFSYTIL